MKHTPGPWAVDGRFVRSDSRKTNPICECPQGGILHTGVDQANAHLIAAAPDLLAAAKFAESVLKANPVELSERMAIERLQVAITKARPQLSQKAKLTA